MFTVLRPESTLIAPPEQSESVRYQINQPTSIELKERVRVDKLVPAGSICLFHDGDKMFQKLRGLLQKLGGFESDARLRRANKFAFAMALHSVCVFFRIIWCELNMQRH